MDSRPSNVVRAVSGKDPCTVPPADLVLWLGALIIVLGFAYLFMEIWFPLKQASAVIAIVTAIVSFYFGATYGKNIGKE